MVLIRSYRSSTDEAAVRQYFAEGMHAMIYEGAMRLFKAHGPYAAMFSASLSGFTYYRGFGLHSAISFGVVSLITFAGFETYALRGKISQYVQHSLHDDLANIDGFYMKNPPSHFWVAADEQTDEVVGCIGLESKSDGWGELRRLTVARAARKCGVASKLHATLLEHAKNNGMKGIFLECSNMQPAAYKFYVKMGYNHESSSSKNLPWYIDNIIRFPLFRMNL